MAVLGYMLVLHKSHNIFGDPMVIPIFMIMTLAFNFGKRCVLRFADRFQIWMVEGEKEHEEVYDEGPGSRQQGALPPGMAAVDETIAECIEDAFAAGYTDDTLSKLLTEAILYIPPGTSIQAAGGSAGMTCSDLPPGAQPSITQEQMDVFLRMQAQGLMPSSTAGTAAFQPNVPQVAPFSTPSCEGYGFCTSHPALPPNVYMGGSSMSGSAGPILGFGTTMGMPCSLNAPPQTFAPSYGVPLASNVAGYAAGGGPAAGGYPDMLGMTMSASLPAGVPPPPSGSGAGGIAAGDDGTFNDFMNAFRTEMRDARAKHARVGTFVPSSHLERQEERRVETLANEIFGIGPHMVAGDDSNVDSDDYDYWCVWWMSDPVPPGL